MNAPYARSAANLIFSGWYWAVILILAVVRIYAVAAYDGTGFPDRFLYLNYADMILSGSTWLHELEVDPLPSTGFRAIGFPLILAAAKFVSGDHFVFVVQCLQTFVSLIACTYLFAAVSRLLLSDAGAFIATLGYGLSVGLAYETSLLPDSIFISCWIIIVSVCVIRWLDRRPLSLVSALLLGLLALPIVCMRGNGIHMLILAVPVITLASIDRSAGWVRPAAACILVFLPGLVAYAGVMEWNRYRTGDAFFTTGGQIALVQPVFEMARLGAEPFEGDDPLRTAIRTHAPDLTYEQIYDVNRHLFSDQGMSPHDIARANMSLYLDTVFDNPAIFARMWFRNFDEKFASGLINPAFGLNQAHLLMTGDRAFPGYSTIMRGGAQGPTNYIYAGLYTVGLLLSVVIFAAAVLLAPLRIIRRTVLARLDRPTIAAAALWIVSIMVHAYYGALFVELRYVVMTVPFLAAVGLWSFRPRDSGSFRR